MDIRNRQFIDAENGLSKDQYNKWIKDSRKRFLGIFPTNSLLYGDNHYKYYGIKSKYTEDELSEPLIGDLNAMQIAYILDSMDVYTIMCLMCKKDPSQSIVQGRGDIIYDEDNSLIHIPNDTTMLECDYYDNNGNPHFIYAFPFEKNNRKWSLNSIKPIHTKQIYEKSWGGSYRTWEGSTTANEVLFRVLRLPVSVVLGSIDSVSTKYSKVLPYDDNLCENLTDINMNKPEKYKELVKRR